MKHLIASAVLAAGIAFSAPTLAQNTDTQTDGNTANVAHTETTAKSMQADSTRPHHTMKSGKHSTGMNNSPDANNAMTGRETIRAPRGTGAGQQRDSN